MIKNKISLYDLESHLDFTCDDFERSRHIIRLETFDNYADQLEYVELFSDQISLESFLEL